MVQRDMQIQCASVGLIHLENWTRDELRIRGRYLGGPPVFFASVRARKISKTKKSPLIDARESWFFRLRKHAPENDTASFCLDGRTL